MGDARNKEMEALHNRTKSIPKALDWVRMKKPDNPSVAEKFFGFTGAGDAFNRVGKSLLASLVSHLVLFSGGLVALFYSLDHSHPSWVEALEVLSSIWAVYQVNKTVDAARALLEVQEATLKDVIEK